MTCLCLPPDPVPVEDLYPDIRSHRFELLSLDKHGEQWLVEFAVDGRRYPAFWEPESNVRGMSGREFLDYLRSQSLTMMTYQMEVEAQCDARLQLV